MDDLVLVLAVALVFTLGGLIGKLTNPSTTRSKKNRSKVHFIPGHTKDTAVSGRKYFLGEPEVEDVWVKQDKKSSLFTLFVKYKKRKKVQ